MASRRALPIALVMIVFASGALAQGAADFPTRPVKIVVPFAAGGPTDVVARILADLLTARWGGQSVVIENRPGAGTIVATAAVANAPADGYTMLIATNSLLINPAIGQKLPYDTLKEFAASAWWRRSRSRWSRTNVAGNTIAELVALAKRSAEPINFTSPGPRGVGHLAGEMLKQRAGITMTHINYNGSAPALTDVIAGRVPIMFDIWHSAKRYVEAGELKLIAGASAERLPTPHRSRRSPKPIRASRCGDQRDVRAGGHTGARPGEARSGPPRRGELGRVRREGAPSRHRRQGQHAGRARCLDAQRDRALGRGREGGEYQRGLGCHACGLAPVLMLRSIAARSDFGLLRKLG